MPYALSNLVDGEMPSARYISASSDATAGEVVLEAADYESKPGWVWSSATNTLRAPTDADELRWAKRDAVAELEASAVTDMQNILPVYRAVVMLSRGNPNPKLDGIKQKDDKLTAKLAQVEAATTVAAVEAAATWED